MPLFFKLRGLIMNKMVEELKKVKIFYIAKIEDNKPKIRPFSSITAFEGNAYICLGTQKEFYKQVKENHNIEISRMYDRGTWIRVSATLKEDNRYEVQETMLNDKTGPSHLYKPNNGRFVTYKLKNAVAYKFNFYVATEEIRENNG